jgi:hypothetical protein
VVNTPTHVRTGNGNTYFTEGRDMRIYKSACSVGGRKMESNNWLPANQDLKLCESCSKTCRTVSAADSPERGRHGRLEVGARVPRCPSLRQLLTELVNAAAPPSLPKRIEILFYYVYVGTYLCYFGIKKRRLNLNSVIPGHPISTACNEYPLSSKCVRTGW